MRLGILVNTSRHLDDIIGIVKAALAKGHEVEMFNMDDGVRLLGTPEFGELCRTGGVGTSFCDYNAKSHSVDTEGLPAELVCGSQYHNAVMVHNADRLIVL